MQSRILLFLCGLTLFKQILWWFSILTSEAYHEDHGWSKVRGKKADGNSALPEHRQLPLSCGRSGATAPLASQLLLRKTRVQTKTFPKEELLMTNHERFTNDKSGLGTRREDSHRVLSLPNWRTRRKPPTEEGDMRDHFYLQGLSVPESMRLFGLTFILFTSLLGNCVPLSGRLNN